MSQLWYFAREGAMQGPMPAEDLRRRFLRGELPKDTLVWSEGMGGWAQANRVAELTQPPPPPPPPPVAAAGAAVAVTTAGGRAAPRPHVLGQRPWARLGARVADILLFQTLLSFLLPRGWIPDSGSLQFQLFMPAFTAVALLLWIPIEAFCLSRWGMTPGKWMYRVRVVHPEGRFLRFGEAARRGLGVYLQGLALGVPGVQLIAMALALRELTETGSAPWDRGRFAVQHAQPRGIHQAAVLAMILLAIVVAPLVYDRFSGI